LVISLLGGWLAAILAGANKWGFAAKAAENFPQSRLAG